MAKSPSETPSKRSKFSSSILAVTVFLSGIFSVSPHKTEVTSARTLKIRLFTLVSAFLFFGSFGVSFYKLYTTALQGNASQPGTEAAAQLMQQLQEQEKGYEVVLQREPDNQAALEGLATARLNMNDFVGALVPLEKLVKLYPDRADYASVLAQAKQQVDDR